MKLPLLFVFLILCLPNTSYAAKKECADLLTKFHNIQAKQRQGQSLKNSNTLRVKEDLARERWWDCENNRSHKNKKKRTVKKSKPSKKKSVKVYKSDNKSTQTFSSNKLVLKGRFSGEKQFKWLAFYKRPKKCAKPKTTQVFAYCMEHKEKQQLVFEQQYEKANR